MTDIGASLFGLEAELAVSAICADREIKVQEVAGAIDRAARRSLAHLPGSSGRLFLPNGLFLVDHGSHPEVATHECTDPAEVVANLFALQSTVRQLADSVCSELRADRVLVTRQNVDYSQLRDASWGAHESYLGRQPIKAYESWLLAHLASRIVYTGAGGLMPDTPGIRFSLSPRVSYLSAVSSPRSTSARGIFCTKDEALSTGFSRVHVLAGDHNCSQRSTWLKVGTTALVIALADLAPDTSCPLRIMDPVGTIKRIAHDQQHSAMVLDESGRKQRMTAVDIQRQLLCLVEPHVASGRMPEWAPAICHAWRKVLDQIDSGLFLDNQAFDWPLKFALFKREVERHGFSEGELAIWSGVLGRLSHVIRSDGPCPAWLDNALLRRMRGLGGGAAAELVRADRVLATSGLSWARLEAHNELRHALCALDIRFGELGSGIFDAWDRTGLIMGHTVVSPEQIAAASDAPTSKSRAAIRGKWIRRLSRGRHRFECGWSGISGPTRQLDLGNPFVSEEEAKWKHGPLKSGVHEFQSIASRIDALNLYREGDYSAALAILHRLLAHQFEVPSTRCHIARILLIQDELSAADTITSAAWSARADAPLYVVARILWLRLAISYCSQADRTEFVESPRVILGRLKSVLTGMRASEEWAMDPVLDHLRLTLPDEQHRLLAGLVEVLSDASNFSGLDSHAEWREALAASIM